MRAITASGIVLRTKAGRIKWETAEAKAPFSPESSESMSMNPVTGSKK